MQESKPVAAAAMLVEEGLISNMSSPVTRAATPADAEGEEGHLEEARGRTATESSPAKKRLPEDSASRKSCPKSPEVYPSKNRPAEATPGLTPPTVLEVPPAEDRLAKDPVNRKRAYKEGLIAMLLSATSGKHAKRKQSAVLGGKKV